MAKVSLWISKDNLATISWDLEPFFKEKQEKMDIRELQELRQDILYQMENCKLKDDPRYEVYQQVLLKCYLAEDEIFKREHKSEIEEKHQGCERKV